MHLDLFSWDEGWKTNLLENLPTSSRSVSCCNQPSISSKFLVKQQACSCCIVGESYKLFVQKQLALELLKIYPTQRMAHFYPNFVHPAYIIGNLCSWIWLGPTHRLEDYILGFSAGGQERRGRLYNIIIISGSSWYAVKELFYMGDKKLLQSKQS